jgi:hypothetical protein
LLLDAVTWTTPSTLHRLLAGDQAQADGRELALMLPFINTIISITVITVLVLKVSLIIRRTISCTVSFLVSMASASDPSESDQHGEYGSREEHGTLSPNGVWYPKPNKQNSSALVPHNSTFDQQLIVAGSAAPVMMSAPVSAPLGTM